jgi:hypothetical protein
MRNCYGLSATNSATSARQMRNDLKADQRAVRRQAERMVADKIEHSLRGSEILSDIPLPEGSDLFSRAGSW